MEAGNEAESSAQWAVAGEWYAKAATERGWAGGRAENEGVGTAAFRAGLMDFMLGQPDSACRWWRGRPDDASRFWWGIARRAAGDTAAGDSALRLVAGRVGYSFYAAAARDTLGQSGWEPGRVELAALWPLTPRYCDEVGLAWDLVAVGAAEDAALVLGRLAAAGYRKSVAVDPDYCDTGLEALEAARLAYSIGRPGLGMALADRSIRLIGDPELQRHTAWSRVPWLYPPAYESLFVAPRDTVVASLEPALLFALVRQESAFDPRARSRSDALGLMQLKLAAATDMARQARDPAPGEAALFDPGRNVRYGARYLARLLRRFEGSVAAALSAYNAGTANVSGRWREVRERGGEALLCEMASNSLAQDYAKRILGYRQAYRELRPTTGAP